jgi:hypothetical protein
MFWSLYCENILHFCDAGVEGARFAERGGGPPVIMLPASVGLAAYGPKPAEALADLKTGTNMPREGPSGMVMVTNEKVLVDGMKGLRFVPGWGVDFWPTVYVVGAWGVIRNERPTRP